MVPLPSGPLGYTQPQFNELGFFVQITALGVLQMYMGLGKAAPRSLFPVGLQPLQRGVQTAGEFLLAHLASPVLCIFPLDALPIADTCMQNFNRHHKNNRLFSWGLACPSERGRNCQARFFYCGTGSSSLSTGKLRACRVQQIKMSEISGHNYHFL